MTGWMTGWSAMTSRSRSHLTGKAWAWDPSWGFTWAFLVSRESNRAPWSCPPSPRHTEQQTKTHVPSWSTLQAGVAGLLCPPPSRAQAKKAQEQGLAEEAGRAGSQETVVFNSPWGSRAVPTLLPCHVSP